MSFCSSTAWNQANGSITLIPIEKNQTLRIRNGHFTIQRKKLNKFNYLPPFLIVPNCTRTLIYLIRHFPDNKKKPSSHMNPMNLMWWTFELLQKIIIGSKDNGGGDGWYFVSSVTADRSKCYLRERFERLREPDLLAALMTRSIGWWTWRMRSLFGSTVSLTQVLLFNLFHDELSLLTRLQLVIWAYPIVWCESFQFVSEPFTF